MPTTALAAPTTDPTPIFELFRGSYGTELLTASVAHFQCFGLLSKQPLPMDAFGKRLGLQKRPLVVLTTALRAFGFLKIDSAGRLALTDLAREHLVPGGAFDVGDYVGLAAQSPGVLEMVERLKTNKPAQIGGGVAYIYREGIQSAMDQSAGARHFTLALAGRAKNVAPNLANVVDLKNAQHLLDVGGGTGIYSIALLEKYPQLTATAIDRAEVLKVAAEVAQNYGVGNRLKLVPGDMFADPLPANVDAVLLSNILHDWDVPECRRLLGRCAEALKPGGRIIVHDVFLNDDHDGPLPVALYSAALFTLTEGRAYSAAEYRGWLRALQLRTDEVRPTAIHCGVLTGTKT